MNIERIYNFYLYNIYEIIHTLGFKAEFKDIVHNFKYVNIDYYNLAETNRNSFLMKYRDNRLGLAQDILDNGMYFPFFPS